MYSEWKPKLDKVEEDHGITDPGMDPACMIGSWAPGFNNTLAQIATDLAGSGANGANLSGLGNYYQGREDANKETPPVVGEDTLVIPRLALRPLKPVGAPVAPDATEAWSRARQHRGRAAPAGADRRRVRLVLRRRHPAVQQRGQTDRLARHRRGRRGGQRHRAGHGRA
ncbi:hypothetical protein ACFQY7_49720 [Actinomadura luteofluorescens]|uniref:hypothetical protein n=1 Tax=Actinomadura luteofluorescens TaxID=46163 RepID=UPI003634627E